ncbi:MAG: hypothetical protein M0R40_01575 [Firmicutes bacterium]|nr:hypothetical protein [Bacillota bacterium]
MKRLFIMCLLFMLLCSGCKNSKWDNDMTDLHNYNRLYLELLEPIVGDNVKRYSNNDLLVYVREIEKDEKWLQMQDILRQMEPTIRYAGEAKHIQSFFARDYNKNIQALIKCVQTGDEEGIDTIEKMTDEEHRYLLDMIININIVGYVNVRNDMR